MEGLGKLAVIGVAYSGPTGYLMGETNLKSLDSAFGTDFVETKNALVNGVSDAASNAWEDVKRGETGEVGESVGQIYYAAVEAVVGTKGAGLVVKGLSTGAKALIGVERLAALTAKISKFANALKQGVLKVVKVGTKKKPSYKIGSSDGGPGTWENRYSPKKGADYQKKTTGAPDNTEYVVKTDKMPSGEKKFDGYNKKLQDSKDWDKWPPKGSGDWAKKRRQEMLNSAKKDADIAKQAGSKLEWHVPTKAKADELRKMFAKEGIDIDVVIVPK